MHQDKKWKLREDETALNERFRFLRYAPQQRFSPHFDGGFKRGARLDLLSSLFSLTSLLPRYYFFHTHFPHLFFIVIFLIFLGLSEQTHYTFIMYLNDDFEGGETVIFPEGQVGVHGRPPMKEVRVKPVKGMALVFRHTGPDHPLHSGAPHVTTGKTKYVLRTDVMYTVDEE
jgi:2OG-Fe(II) oxygenase superfamily